jgi:hypothetical protein
MTPRRALALLLIAAACTKAPVYEPLSDSALGYAMDAPKGWARDDAPDAAGRLAATTTFVGDAEPQSEGEPLGAVLSVTRLLRDPAAAKASPAARKAFAEGVLAPTRALFPDDGPHAAASERYGRDYEHGGPSPLHGSARPVPMRVEGRVLRTADAYFVVELRGERSKFDRHRPVLERALASFRPLK